jgi:oligopeptide transport system substrate-binding protein
MKGELDDWTPAADEVVEYSTSEQLYQVDETYTQRLFFNHNLENLKKMDQEGNQNSVVLSNYKFRQAMSLALDRSNFVTATAGYKPAYSLINSLYFYDVYNDPASIYRNTEEAMQAVCNIYGVKYGEGTPYADLKAAYESITGYNLTEAKALMTEACKELVEAGLYKEGEKIVIKMGWKKGANDSTDQQQITLLNNYLNEALKDTGFGEIELQGIDNINDRYKDVANGVYAIGWGAWGGAAFYPFTMFRVYCDPDYTDIHEIGSWNPAEETLTLTIDGEEVTMTWQQWSNCMTGSGKYANASNETKLQILAAIEENYIELYHCIPVCATTVCSMLSYKMSYYTENYNIMYGFGGMRLLKYNYSDAEWAKYVADQGGTLSYT